MLKEMFAAAVMASLIAGAAPPAAAGPPCPCGGLAADIPLSGDRLRPHVDALEPGGMRNPVAVTRTAPDGSEDTIYVDPRTFTPVLPGMPGCLTAP